jgi:hypothetical protein
MAAIRTFDIPYLEIDYDEFLDAPAGVACRLSDFFGISVTAADLNVRPELNHNYLRGRISGTLRTLTRVLPTRTKSVIKRIVPQSVIDALYPEKKLARTAKHLDSAAQPAFDRVSPITATGRNGIRVNGVTEPTIMRKRSP